MAKKLSVLVIDDDEEFLELAEYGLKIGGCTVKTAKGGPEGLEIANEKTPEVILLDTSMPGMDGLQVLSELKHNIKTIRIPVFMMTAKTTLGDVENAFDLGADDYITKPVEFMRLGKIIKDKYKKYLEKIA